MNVRSVKTMMCNRCNSTFTRHDEYVKYGGKVWCSETCLERMAERKDWDMEKVEDEKIIVT